MRGNLVGNIINGGFVAQQNEWIYYSNFEDGNKLYKMKEDGTEKIKLSDDKVKHINVINECIYYTDFLGHALYKIKNDGSNRINILDNEEYVKEIYADPNGYYKLNYKYDLVPMNIENLNVIDDKIYFSEFWGEGVIKIQKGINKLFEIENNITNCLSIKDEYLYFTNEQFEGIYRKKDIDLELMLETKYKNKRVHVPFGRKEMVLDDEYIFCINSSGDWIYYIKSSEDTCNPFSESFCGYLYKVKCDGSENQKITDDLVRGINVVDDCIYYINYSDDRTLYRVMVDGTKREKLGQREGLRYINVTQNWIYYYTNKYNLYRINAEGLCEQGIQNV